MGSRVLGAILTVMMLPLAGCLAEEDRALAASPAPARAAVSSKLVADVAAMRRATDRYAGDLDAALADGYMRITGMMPGMGHHFLDPAVEGFDPARPPILIYTSDGDSPDLVAVEWVFPEVPEEPPLEGATYGSFPAACHYEDGEFVPSDTEELCAGESGTGAAFTFWHPDLVTLHVWVRLHNPDGLFSPTNPLVGVGHAAQGEGRSTAAGPRPF